MKGALKFSILILEVLEQNSFDILGVSETWLDKSVDDYRVLMHGYDVLGENRKKR